MKDKTVILIAVRLNSKRLKKKAILNLYDQPLILKLTERVNKSKLSSDLVWCTSTNKQDDELEVLAQSNNIKIFRGSEEDVMSRFIIVGEKLDAKNIVRVTGDNPLTDPEVIDFLIHTHIKNNAEYTYCNSIPIGTRSEIVDLKMLKRCYQLIQDPESSEYMTWMLNRPDYFKTQKLTYPNSKINRAEISLTVDDKESYFNLQKIYNYFKTNLVSLEKIVEWIDMNPKFLKKLVQIKNQQKNLKNINCKFKNE